MNEGGRIRAFLAVNPPDEWCRELSLRVDPMRLSLRGCSVLRWVPPPSWHLTLQFLGDWPEGLLKELQEALTARPVSPAFTLRSRGLGTFPRQGDPRVLFVHLEEGEQIVNLATGVRRVVDEVWPEGPQDTRAFLPHLTLARVKGRLSEEQRARLVGLDLSGLPALAVTGFRLVGSDLTGASAHHTELGRFSLAGEEQTG